MRQIHGYISTRQILKPFGNGWTWSIHIRADDYGWTGEIHRAGGGPYFKSAKGAESKARAVAKELNIKLDD